MVEELVPLFKKKRKQFIRRLKEVESAVLQHKNNEAIQHPRLQWFLDWNFDEVPPSSLQPGYAALFRRIATGAHAAKDAARAEDVQPSFFYPRAGPFNTNSLAHAARHGGRAQDRFPPVAAELPRQQPSEVGKRYVEILRTGGEGERQALGKMYHELPGEIRPLLRDKTVLTDHDYDDQNTNLRFMTVGKEELPWNQRD